MSNTSVVIAASTQMNDLLNTCPLGAVYQVLALAQHVYRVTRRHEDAIDVF